MTDRQQLERLMAIVVQAREAQVTYYRGRKNVSSEHVKKLLNDARMKADSLDNLVRQLIKQGYTPFKHSEIEQPKMF
jgi:hypothetical protein